MQRLPAILTLTGYAFLAWLLVLAGMYFYTPSRSFDLPGLLWFTHLILLYIHEAGHLFFSVFGRTVSILGGSLLQVLAPAVWYIVATYERSALSSTAMFFTGISIMDVSIYIKDAEVLQLPLIGGLSSAHHDWLNLLRQWEMLDSAFVLGEMVFWLGCGTAAAGLFFGVRRAAEDLRHG